MALPEHLHPKTYWEKRAELMEESVWRLANILAGALPPQYGHMVGDHMRQWGDLINKLKDERPAPPDGAA